MKHKISLEKIENIILKSKEKSILEKFTAGVDSYKILCDYIAEKSKTGEFVPIKNSGLNGKNPPLYNVYWQIEEEKESNEFDDELNFKLSPKLSMEYYKKHIEQYRKDRDAILKLSDFYKNESEKQKLKKAESVNERSFEIWGQEKFLSRGQGKRILNRCGLELSFFNIYETTEPLAYYSRTRNIPQNLLILENKDTFFSMRRHLLEGNEEILGIKIDTLIYGAGKILTCVWNLICRRKETKYFILEIWTMKVLEFMRI